MQMQSVPETLPRGVRLLIQAAQAAPSADNMQPWRFQWSNGELGLTSGGGAASDPVFAGDRHCERLTMGAVIENLMQAAAAIGLDVHWALKPEGPRYLKGRIANAAASTAVLATVHQLPLFARHTNRLGYRRGEVPASVVESIAALSEGDCRLAAYTDAGSIAAYSRLVETASGLRFRIPELHAWFSAALRFTPRDVAAGTGLDVATIDLPPGGRLLLHLIRDWKRLARLNHLGAYRLLAHVEARKLRDSALLVAVLGPEDAPAQIAAGRLMERTWIRLNAAGLAVQPFYAVTDMLRRYERGRIPAHLRRDALQLNGGIKQLLPPGETLHMLLRAGIPGKPPGRARRLPIEQLWSRAADLQANDPRGTEAGRFPPHATVG